MKGSWESYIDPIQRADGVYMYMSIVQSSSMYIHCSINSKPNICAISHPIKLESRHDWQSALTGPHRVPPSTATIFQ